MKIARLMTIFSPLLIYGGLQIIAFMPEWFYYILAIVNIIVMFTMYYFAKASKLSHAWFNILSLPFIFVNVSILYASVLSSSLLLQLVYLIFLIAFFFYLRNLYIYLFKPLRYKSQSLENNNFFITFLSLFYTIAGILSLKSFMNIEIWQSLIAILIVMLILLFQLYWFYQIKFKNNLLFSIIISISMIEIIAASTYLPHSYSIIALINAIIFYSVLGLSLLYLTYKLTKRQLKTYLSFSIIALVLILLSSRWI